jgi:hypothetical protein
MIGCVAWPSTPDGAAACCALVKRPRRRASKHGNDPRSSAWHGPSPVRYSHTEARRWLRPARTRGARIGIAASLWWKGRGGRLVDGLVGCRGAESTHRPRTSQTPGRLREECSRPSRSCRRRSSKRWRSTSSPVLPAWAGRRLITRRSRVQIPPPPPTKMQVRAGADALALLFVGRSSTGSSTGWIDRFHRIATGSHGLRATCAHRSVGGRRDRELATGWSDAGLGFTGTCLATRGGQRSAHGRDRRAPSPGHF